MNVTTSTKLIQQSHTILQWGYKTIQNVIERKIKGINKTTIIK